MAEFNPITEVNVPFHVSAPVCIAEGGSQSWHVNKDLPKPESCNRLHMLGFLHVMRERPSDY
jgi:hypothetical protein